MHLFLGGAAGVSLCHVFGTVLCGKGKEIRNIGIPVHKASEAENHCSGEGDRFSSEPAGLDQPGAVLYTTMGMFFTQILFFALGLLFASVLLSYKAAVRTGTISMLAAYALAFTAEYTGNHFLDYLTPLRYFDVYEVALHGFHLPYIFLTIVVAGICVAAALKQWKRREL